MRRQRDPFGAFGQKLYLSREEIEKACEDALKESGFLPGVPSEVRVEAFVEKHFDLRVEYRDDLGEGVLGCTQFNSTGKPVRIIIGDTGQDDGVPFERRLRSTTAHEAGHALLHSLLFMQDDRQLSLLKERGAGNIDLAKCRILCRDEDLRGKTGTGYDGRWWEWQANQAIGGFLLPRGLVTESLRSLLRSGSLAGPGNLPAEEREDCVRLVSDTFNVNPVVARIRLEVLFPAGESGQLLL